MLIIYIRGALIKFSDFFVKAFKIVAEQFVGNFILNELELICLLTIKWFQVQGVNAKYGIIFNFFFVWIVQFWKNRNKPKFSLLALLLDETDIQDTAGEVGTSSVVMYTNGTLHMADQKLGDQIEPTNNSSVRIRGVALRTCRKLWTIGRAGKRG